MDEKTIRLLIILCVVLTIVCLIVLAISFFVRRAAKKDKTERFTENEHRKVDRALRSWARTNYALVTDNFTFSYKGKQYVIDHLMLGEFGLFVADDLIEKGEVYGNEKDAVWVHYFGDEKTEIPNMAAALAQKVAALRGRLGEKGLYGMRILSSTISVYRKTELFLPDHLAPVLLKKLRDKLSSAEFSKQDKTDRDKLIAALEAISEGEE